MIDLLGYVAFFLTTALVFALISLGLNLQWGLTGLFNVGVAGFVAIGAYTSALMTTPDDPARFGGFARGAILHPPMYISREVAHAYGIFRRQVQDRALQRLGCHTPPRSIPFERRSHRTAAVRQQNPPHARLWRRA